MRLPWSDRSSALVVVVACALVLAAAGAAFGYDRSSQDRLIRGVRIAGINVGGLTAEQAGAVLRERVEAPLHRPLTVRSAGLAIELTPWELGYRVDVGRAVAGALEAAHEGGALVRLWRRLVGSGDAHPLRPALDLDRLREAAAGIADRVHADPVDAKLEVREGWLAVQPSRTGRRLERDDAERRLIEALRRRVSDVDLPALEVPAAVPASAFERVLLVRLGENRLYLYEHGEITRSYVVATGAPGFETPRGMFTVVNKRVNPRWINPGSDWAKQMPSSIAPGPDNPLGSRAMDLDVSGIRIHGTPDAASIGRSVSHGCIRMRMGEAEELFERVAVGTKVVIVAPAAGSLTAA